MRTTLTLDPDVGAKLAKLVEQNDESLKAVVNRLLRQALRDQERLQPRPRRRLAMNLIDSPVRPGIDLERLNALAFDSDFEDGDGHQP